MSEEYSPGDDCECSAYCEMECGCGVDWTDPMIYRLRDTLQQVVDSRQYLPVKLLDRIIDLIGEVDA